MRMIVCAQLLGVRVVVIGLVTCSQDCQWLVCSTSNMQVVGLAMLVSDGLGGLGLGAW